MTAEIGQAAIFLSVLSCLWAIAFLSVGLRMRNPNAIQSGRNAVIATFILISIATGALIYGFLTDDFSMRYVVEVSSAAQPLFYKITALWGRMSGSLLFWLWILTVVGAVVAWQSRQRNEETQDTLADHALIPIVIVQLFFTILVTGLIEGIYNPLARFPNGQVAADGQGMNPLLQTPLMAIHPPTLYVGWISLTVPFAFAVGALTSGRVGSEWILRTRRWTLFSWIILTIGIALGGNWAYKELGWGGYWAWDPVENSSFMPWLLGTAYLHSVMIQEKRNMLKLWNILLITLAFQFTLLGTFITRSGIITSVHAFVESNIGPYFLGFIFASTAGVLGLVIYRWKRLKSANQLESLLSRESAFVLNNWLLVGLTLIILWGTLWPVISEAINGEKSSVPESFFNKIVILPGIALLFLTGAGPIISWRKITANNFRRLFVFPLLMGLVGGALTWGFLVLIRDTFPLFLVLCSVAAAFLVDGALTWGFLALIGDVFPLYSVLCSFAAVFVCVAIFAEFYRGARLRAKRQETSFLNGLNLLIQRNKRRYGGYIIHIGIVILYIGIMGSKGYFQLESRSMTFGESMDVGKYQLTMRDSFQKDYANYRRTAVVFDVAKDGKQIDSMEAARHFYYRVGQGDQDTVESAIRHFGLNDLYVAIGNIPPDFKAGGVVNVQAYHNPLIRVVWIGIAVMVLGGIVAIAEKSDRSQDS